MPILVYKETGELVYTIKILIIFIIIHILIFVRVEITLWKLVLYEIVFLNSFFVLPSTHQNIKILKEYTSYSSFLNLCNIT